MSDRNIEAVFDLVTEKRLAGSIDSFKIKAYRWENLTEQSKAAYMFMLAAMNKNKHIDLPFSGYVPNEDYIDVTGTDETAFGLLVNTTGAIVTKLFSRESMTPVLVVEIHSGNADKTRLDKALDMAQIGRPGKLLTATLKIRNGRLESTSCSFLFVVENSNGMRMHNEAFKYTTSSESIQQFIKSLFDGFIDSYFERMDRLLGDKELKEQFQAILGKQSVFLKHPIIYGLCSDDFTGPGENGSDEYWELHSMKYGAFIMDVMSPAIFYMSDEVSRGLKERAQLLQIALEKRSLRASVGSKGRTSSGKTKRL